MGRESPPVRPSVLLLRCVHRKVLGPFPIHAREQHFLSPSFPLNREPDPPASFVVSSSIHTPVSQPIDLHKSWPSSYADGGLVSWSTVNATDWASPNPGNLKVSFPHIRCVLLDPLLPPTSTLSSHAHGRTITHAHG